MKIEYEAGPHFLIVKIIGEWTDFEANKAIDEIKLHCERSQSTKVLFDLQELSYPANDSIRFNSGKKLAETLSSYKIAGFSQPEKINYLGEITATNRGAHFKMFGSEEKAIKWLMKNE
ncbi:MAG: hypothetical protein EOO46_17815 [Flavobacterium sp.]|nr:MAG: hypothetical protein EOO46_17815 [Flavobacterium sp.]